MSDDLVTDAMLLAFHEEIYDRGQSHLLRVDPSVVGRAIEAAITEQRTSPLVVLVHALHQSNIDWEKEARSCGDPRCNRDCVHIAEIRRIVRLVRGE